MAAPDNDPQLEQRFRTLAAEWDEETGHLSSINQIAMHPAYQQIIGIGPAVVPLLLRDLDRTHAHWFWALPRSPATIPFRGKTGGTSRGWRRRGWSGDDHEG